MTGIGLLCIISHVFGIWLDWLDPQSFRSAMSRLYSQFGRRIRLLSGAMLVAVAMCLLPVSSLAAGAADEAAQGGKGRFHYEYVVQDGDTLYLVAKKFGVSMERLKKWNRRVVGRKGKLKVGKTMKVYSNVPIRPKRTAFYVVKSGDSLYRIAKKLGCEIGELKKLNAIRNSVIQPKDRLVYLTDAPEKVSESVGYCFNGKLINGEKLPPGPGYTFGHRPNIYGTNETITLLLDSIARYRRKYPDGPIVVVGNLSQRGGGKLDPHKSHQSGRDVDLGYIHKKKFQPINHMMATNEQNMDVRKTWYLLETLLKTEKVEKMFIDYKIQDRKSVV